MLYPSFLGITMFLLRFLLFLSIIILFHPPVFSRTQQTTAAEVFFDFVDQHTKDIDVTMGSTWLNNILKHTESWTASDANEFLNSLKTSNFSVPHILAILKDTESLQRIQGRLNSFQFQTGSDVFIDYVRDHLRKKLRQNQLYLEGEMLELALESLILAEMVSRRNAPLWEERISTHAVSWTATEAILLLDDLENKWDMDPNLIIERLNSTSFFQNTTYTLFTSRLEVYTEHLGESYVKGILNRTFTPFETESRVNFLRRGRDYDQEQMIRFLVISNPETFSRNDLPTDKITYLEELLEVDDRDGKLELDEALQSRNSAGISNFKVYKNEEGHLENEYVKFLRDRGFTPLQIADLFKSDPGAFCIGDLSNDKIIYLEEYLGKGDRNEGKKKLDQIILQKGGFRVLVLFEYNSNDQTNAVIDFLENGLRLNQDQVIKIIEDYFLELFVIGLTEETSKRYIERLMERVPDICQQSLLQAS